MSQENFVRYVCDRCEESVFIPSPYGVVNNPPYPWRNVSWITRESGKQPTHFIMRTYCSLRCELDDYDQEKPDPHQT